MTLAWINALLAHPIALVLLASVNTLGWASLYNLPVRYMGFCFIMTAFGYSTKVTLLAAGAHVLAGTFAASLVIGTLAIFFAKQYAVLPKVLVVPSVICLMPGTAAYKAMVTGIEIGYFGYSSALFEVLITQFSYALFVIACVVMGVSLPEILFWRKKPII